MEVKRVTYRCRPNYPARTALPIEDARRLPRRWQGNAKIAAAIAGAALLAPAIRAQRPHDFVLGRRIHRVQLVGPNMTQIILAEGKRAGLALESCRRTFDLDLPKSDGGPTHARCSIVGWDSKHRVGMAYISWPYQNPSDVAARARRYLAQTNLAGRVRVIEDRKGEDIVARKRRIQREIRSFVNWLKAQSVI